MDYRQCIQNSIDYIEENLQACISVDELARIAGFSPYHYYRVFNAYVGIPVVEYMRNRRLAHAATRLTCGRRISDIAMDYGFDTYNGFAKAFRKVYGCSPERYRIHVSGQPPQKVNLFILEQYNLKGSIVVEPKIVEQPAAKIAGLELKTSCSDGRNMREIPAFWASVIPEKLALLHKQLHAVHHHEIGACLPPDPATGNFSYVIALEVQDYEGAAPDMFRGEIPAATYAVFKVPTVESTDSPEFSNAIQGTWKYIHGTWFPNSGYEFAEGKIDYELYYEGAKVEIYIPVVKKA